MSNGIMMLIGKREVSACYKRTYLVDEVTVDNVINRAGGCYCSVWITPSPICGETKYNISQLIALQICCTFYYFMVKFHIITGH